MQISSVPVSYANPLASKYLNHFSEVGHLFEHDPNKSSSFKDRHEIIMREYHTDRKELVRILTDYNQRLHCGNKTKENLQRLLELDTVAIVTGQQAGIFTGPLYTIYKTITTIQLAKDMTTKLGSDVVPLFWVAAEDHDYAEIDHMDFINKEQEPTRLKLDYIPDGKFSIGHIPVTEAVTELINRLEAETNPSECKNEIIDKIREFANENNNLADWFAAIMAWLFGKYGLIIVNPLDSDLRRLWSKTFQAFIDKADLVNEKLHNGMAKVEALGCEPQVEQMDNSINMFLYVEGQRLPLLKAGEQHSIRGEEKHYTYDELLSIAQNNPELFSPNVVLRPVAQDALLPILAYVAGPGEISYYALYREIYPLFGQTMPVIYPRINITILERGIAKHLDKYHIDFTQGLSGLNTKLDEILQKQDSIGIDYIFNEFTDQTQQSFQELLKKVTLIDQELAKHGNESLNKINYQIEHLRKKTHQYHRKSCDLIIKRFHNVENNLFPRHNWQERVLNIFPYLFKYGTTFLEDLAETQLIGDNLHKLIYPTA